MTFYIENKSILIKDVIQFCGGIRLQIELKVVIAILENKI